MLEVIAAVGVVVNGILAQVLAYLNAKRTGSAVADAVRATISPLPAPVPPAG